MVSEDVRVMSSNSLSFTATRHLASLLQLLTFPRCLGAAVTRQLSTERLSRGRARAVRRLLMNEYDLFASSELKRVFT